MNKARVSTKPTTTVESLMTRSVALVTARMSLRDTVAIMLAKQASCLLVLEGERLVGILTERDLTAERLSNARWSSGVSFI